MSYQALGAGIDALCMACTDEKCDFKPMMMKRRALGPRDVMIEMKYCGVCHSDLHHAANHNMGRTPYPCVPGHELAGLVVAVGDDCTKIQVGMHVGVGCLVDACLECTQCLRGEEQKCSKSVGTYGKAVKEGARAFTPGGHTLGGYTKTFVVFEHFAIIVPTGYPLEAVGPVMCAGITMYDPLVKLGAGGTRKRVGIVGLGGLGVMGIKLAKAMGCEVTAISRSAAKEEMAKRAGADTFANSTRPEELAKGSLDIILNTVPAFHDYDPFTRMLSADGKHVMLGLHKGIVAGYILGVATGGRSRVMHSGIGGIKSTQAVVDLCAKHHILPEYKLMPCESLNEIYTMLDASNDAGVRFVLDIASSLDDETVARCTLPPPVLAKPTGPMSIVGGLLEALRLFCCCRT